MADTFATPSDLASHLQQDVDTASATLALETATGTVQEYLGWRVLAETVTGLQVIPYGSVFILPTAWLTALTVVEYGVTLPTTPGQAYIFTPAGLVTRVFYGGIVERPWLIPVFATFTHGFGAASVPQVIKAVTLSVAARVYDNPTGLRSESAGDGQEVKSTGGQNSFAGAWLTDLEQAALVGWKTDPVAVAV